MEVKRCSVVDTRLHKRGRRAAIGGIAGAVAAGTALLGGTVAPVAAQTADLTPTGRLRVAVTNNRALNIKDPATGEWRGIWIDLARTVAERLAVPMVIVEYAGDAARDAQAGANEWDISYTTDRPEQAAAAGRASGIPYLDVDNTLVVGPDSAIRRIADMDRPGVRIAAVEGTPPERTLSGLVRQAEVVRVTTNVELVPLLQQGRVEALASNRDNVTGYAAQVPGARVLADRYAVQQQRIGLAAGRSTASVALVSEVTRQALASGLIREAIARHGVQGVQPSPLTPAIRLPQTGGALPYPAHSWVLGTGGALLALGLARCCAAR